MKYVLIILALIGITVSALALREHYRPFGEEAPCDINARWDCGTVNKSPYAVIPQGAEHGIPVAAIGVAGYLLLGILAFRRAYGLTLLFAVPALAFALYLAYFEASPNKLGVWCIYCAISLGTISLMTLLLLITIIATCLRKRNDGIRPASS
jgi:vitamin-K-epoxide reductase (warfarin-sensitive)